MRLCAGLLQVLRALHLPTAVAGGLFKAVQLAWDFESPAHPNPFEIFLCPWASSVGAVGIGTMNMGLMPDMPMDSHTPTASL